MNSSSQVVRKRLDEDCLLHGELHPDIAERLKRVRELPVRCVANLRSVERDQQGVWLVWQYVEGTTLEQFLVEGASRMEHERIGRDLKRAVAGLHAQGMVHGDLHARNVIIDPHGEIVLTHISPLLFYDPGPDAAALEGLLSKLGNAPDKPYRMSDSPDTTDRSARAWAWALAGGAILGALLMFAGILWYIQA